MTAAGRDVESINERSALPLGSGEKPSAHPVGEVHPGTVGCGAQLGDIVGGDAELDRLAARVVERRAASARTHAAENSGHGKSLTSRTFEDHNKSMTNTAKTESTKVVSAPSGVNHAYVSTFGVMRTECGRRVPPAHGWFGPIDQPVTCAQCLRSQ